MYSIVSHQYIVYNTSHDCIHVFFLTAGNSVTNHCMQSKKPPSAAKGHRQKLLFLNQQCLFYFAFYTCQNKAQIRQTVQANQNIGVNRFVFSQTQQATLGTTGSSACDVQCGSTYSIAGDNKMAQRLQQRIKLVDYIFKQLNVFFFDVRFGQVEAGMSAITDMSSFCTLKMVSRTSSRVT